MRPYEIYKTTQGIILSWVRLQPNGQRSFLMATDGRETQRVKRSHIHLPGRPNCWQRAYLDKLMRYATVLFPTSLSAGFISPLPKHCSSRMEGGSKTIQTLSTLGFTATKTHKQTNHNLHANFFQPLCKKPCENPSQTSNRRLYILTFL